MSPYTIVEVKFDGHEVGLTLRNEANGTVFTTRLKADDFFNLMQKDKIDYEQIK